MACNAPADIDCRGTSCNYCVHSSFSGPTTPENPLDGMVRTPTFEKALRDIFPIADRVFNLVYRNCALNSDALMLKEAIDVLKKAAF